MLRSPAQRAAVTSHFACRPQPKLRPKTAPAEISLVFSLVWQERKRRTGKPTEAFSQAKGPFSGADDGIRTRDPHLGKVVLYQLSHVRTP